MNTTAALLLIESNIDIIQDHASPNDSALLCARQASDCIANHDNDVPFPTFVNETSRLPLTWIQSAMGWIIRAGQHQFGFNAPQEWTRFEDIMEASVRERITDAAALS